MDERVRGSYVHLFTDHLGTTIEGCFYALHLPTGGLIAALPLAASGTRRSDGCSGRTTGLPDVVFSNTSTEPSYTPAIVRLPANQVSS